MRKLILTSRDKELLEHVALHRACSVELLAERFFATNPFTGTPNTNPKKACERRLTALRKNNLVELARVRCDDGGVRAVVRPAAAADSALAERASRRDIAPREQSHHLRTLEAIRRVTNDVKHRGGRVLSFRVEAAVRAEQQRGRKTTRGDTFESFPDAVCSVALPGPGGRERVVSIAVEYVTSKYTDKDIAEKRASFGRAYDEALWFADRPHTAQRVRKITGGACSILS